ncbi:hypothetical protein NKJ48_14215 [Mesorhizobium sp. M0114]|uniref:hypothetical protein n=1 Tax=unclassified Mesorhizobium TaxID=325217 RepID=UPI003334BFF1
MSKKRGDYRGGSTVLSAQGTGFSYDPNFPQRKKKHPKIHKEDWAYDPPPLTAAEQAENERLKAAMYGVQSPARTTKR